MKIVGLQKTTLIDYPNKIAATIFLFGCNFRCGFCYNRELVLGNPEDVYINEDVLNFLESRKNKLEAVCITGGEPLLTLEKEFLEKIKKLGYLIKIDTNGTFPEKLKELIDEGLVDYVAMDIKGAKEDYKRIACADVELLKIEESIRIISLLKNYEFRTTILNEFHTKEKMKKLARWLNEVCNKKPRAYFLQGFKNKGDFIDKRYERVDNTRDLYLSELKEEIIGDFELVGIRC
jgi:pyruvate formate lyase activating enzyme